MTPQESQNTNADTNGQKRTFNPMRCTQEIVYINGVESLRCNHLSYANMWVYDNRENGTITPNDNVEIRTI